jgi:hypothetical protein
MWMNMRVEGPFTPPSPRNRSRSLLAVLQRQLAQQQQQLQQQQEDRRYGGGGSKVEDTQTTLDRIDKIRAAMQDHDNKRKRHIQDSEFDEDNRRKKHIRQQELEEALHQKQLAAINASY